MSPVRLFLPAGSLGPATEAPQIVELSAQDGHYLLHVLRRRPGDPVTLCDGTVEAAAQLLAPSSSTGTGAGAAGVRLKTGAASLAPAPPPVQVTLLLGLLKGEKFDLVVQKATELGVHRVVPVRCARSVPVLSGHRAEGRRERWERIARAAAQQCRRPDLPEIGAPLPLAEALRARGEDLRLVFSEGAMGTSLHEVLPGRLPPRIAVLVGPEGGLTEEEVGAAQGAGFVLCGLGRRILRAETAALSALAILDHIAADPHRPHPAERSKIAISPLEL